MTPSTLNLPSANTLAVDPSPEPPNRRILIIDDNPGIHADFQKILRPSGARTHPGAPVSDPILGSEFLGNVPQTTKPKPGFELVSAFQGKDGLVAVLEAMRMKRPFAVAFVDMRMPPGWSGVETIARLWQADPDLQVVICTAFSDYSWEQIVAELGTTDRLLILKKPFDVIEARQLGHALTEKWQLLQQTRVQVAHLEEVGRQLVRMQNQLLVDIMERKKAEAELRKLARAVEQSTVSIVITDLLGSIEYVNPKFCAVTGYSFEEVRGQYPHILKPGEMPVESYRQLWDRITAGEEWRGEFRNQKKNGELYWESIFISAIRDDRGNITHFVWVKEDITERKLAAQQSAEHEEKEERSRWALEHERELYHIQSRFVSMVSHEFRTPLCVIGMAGSLLGQYSDRMTAEERAGQIEGIRTSVEHMTLIMEDLLLHGEFEAGRMQCHPAPMNVEALCYRLIAELSSHPGAPRSIECAIAPNAREACLDEHVLRHILGNLLSNAVKYSSPDQPVSLEVGLVAGNTHPQGDSRTSPQDQLQFKVSDAGIGIPAADLGRLFQTFHRASNVGSRPGTGMGLAIVKEFVELHRGTLKIESKEGMGTSVWVWLPIALPEGAQGTL